MGPETTGSRKVVRTRRDRRQRRVGGHLFEQASVLARAKKALLHLVSLVSDVRQGGNTMGEVSSEPEVAARAVEDLTKMDVDPAKGERLY